MKTRRYGDFFWRLCFWSSGLVILGIVTAILAILFIRGGGSVTWAFLTTSPQGLFLGTEGGILPAITGTLSLVAIATASVAVPALIIAIYLVEYSGSSFYGECITLLVQSMIGIPSILTGLFGYSFFVLYLDFGISLLSGGLTLAVMVFPTLVVLMRDALLAVNDDYRLLGTALGVSRCYLLRRVILPSATPSLFSAILLAMGYAAGATAPIMITAAVIMSRGSLGLLKPVMALPYHLYILFSQHISLEKAYSTALVLVLLLLIFNILALALRRN